jgi:D-serine deaminase-like pyridoxal phosphate-dependent protein
VLLASTSSAAKTDPLMALKRLRRLAVVLDNERWRRLSERRADGVDVRFLVECDTGMGRNGVQSPSRLTWRALR